MRLWVTRHVSIPIGFSNTLRLYTCIIRRNSPLFQSLLGFLIRCDEARSSVINNGVVVSIPIGFSNTLRPTPVQPTYDIWRVSIPIGFSNTLRPSRTTTKQNYIKGFQSLLGFLIRCDQKGAHPYFVFSTFQSLLGFLIRCDFYFLRGVQHNWISFNPYWVF